MMPQFRHSNLDRGHEPGAAKFCSVLELLPTSPSSFFETICTSQCSPHPPQCCLPACPHLIPSPWPWGFPQLPRQPARAHTKLSSHNLGSPCPPPYGICLTRTEPPIVGPVLCWWLRPPTPAMLQPTLGAFGGDSTLIRDPRGLCLGPTITKG